jgi:hypothetical protein
MEQMAVEGVWNLGSFVAKAGGIRFVTQQACGCRQSLQGPDNKSQSPSVPSL